MITPRHTRLVRVPDLASFQATLTALAQDLGPADARDTFVLVPTRAAGEQLRRTVEDRLLDARAAGTDLADSRHPHAICTTSSRAAASASVIVV